MTIFSERAARVELLLLDVDGVLTDGSVIYSDSGEELKRFHVRDGSALKLWRVAGKKAAILSGRSSLAVTRRAAELDIHPVHQGSRNKGTTLKEIVRETGVAADCICVMGDDLPDLPLFELCGLRIAPADACAEIRAAADYVCQTPGGHGAVREAIEMLLKTAGLWDNLIAEWRLSG